MQELNNEEKIIRTIYSKYRINEHSKLMANIGKTKNEHSARGVLNSSMYCSAVLKLWEDFILLFIEELLSILKANNKKDFILSNNNIVISLIDELLEESNKNILNGASFESQFKSTQGNIREKAINKWNVEAELIELGIESTKNKCHKSNNSTSILFVASDPTDEARLRLGEEFREINDCIESSPQRDSLQLELPQLSLRPKDISQAMLKYCPNVLHFSGHGSSAGELCFEDKNGNSKSITPDALSTLFDCFDSLECVVLNACYSEVQANSINEHVKYVIGMNDSISDEAAIHFSIGFYQALGAGRSYVDAFNLGVAQIKINGLSDEAGIPKLIKK